MHIFIVFMLVYKGNTTCVCVQACSSSIEAHMICGNFKVHTLIPRILNLYKYTYVYILSKYMQLHIYICVDQ